MLQPSEGIMVCLRLATLSGAAMLVLGVASSASATVFHNTGRGLADFARDPNWIVERVQGGTPFTGPQAAWVMDTTSYPVIGAYRHQGYSSSKWITIGRDGTCANNDIFRFSTTFTLPGGSSNDDPPTGPGTGYRFTGKFSSDNASELYVNGQLIAALPHYGPLGYSFQAIKDFDATNALRGGVNTVSFLVGSADTMGSNQGPMFEWMGLRAEGTLSPVPEPASLATIGIGVAALLRRRKRH